MDTQAEPSAPIPFRRPASSAVPVAQASVGSSALQLARPQALIVDDCRFIAERIARTLEARGFECTLVSDGYSGLKLLRDVHFELVVADVNTPMVDGFSLLRCIRRDAEHFRTPVLMLSAEYSSVDQERSLGLCAGYMTKPLQQRPLNAMLDAMLDG